MRIESQTGPVSINRKNMQRIVEVTAEPEATLSEALAAVQARLPELAVPRDFSVGFGAEVEEQARAFGQLRLVLILALVLVYAVMASQYESLRDPFIIMFSVPTAAIGVVLALWLTGTSFNMQAYIGIIMLAGIVVSNGILLVDYTNVLRRRDKIPLRDAVELAGRTRLRPILFGGHHERDRRPGTENVAGIVGLGAAAELACQRLADESAPSAESSTTRSPPRSTSGTTAARLKRSSRSLVCRSRTPASTTNGTIFSW